MEPFPFLHCTKEDQCLPRVIGGPYEIRNGLLMFIALSLLLQFAADVLLFGGATSQHLAGVVHNLEDIPLSFELIVLGALVILGLHRLVLYAAVVSLSYNLYYTGSLQFSGALGFDQP